MLFVKMYNTVMRDVAMTTAALTAASCRQNKRSKQPLGNIPVNVNQFLCTLKVQSGSARGHNHNQ